MPSQLHKKAIARITPEKRALMVKSLEIVSQVQTILDRRQITQKQLAAMLDISQPAVSKMLSPGGNLELKTIIKLESLLGEPILITPKQAEAEMCKKVERAQEYRLSGEYMAVAYVEGESTLAWISVN